MIIEQGKDGRPACPDCVGIAKPRHTVRVGNADYRRFLADETLNRIRALNLGFEVNQQDFHMSNLGHLRILTQRGLTSSTYEAATT